MYLSSGMCFAFTAIDTSGETLWKMRNSGVSTIMTCFDGPVFFLLLLDAYECCEFSNASSYIQNVVLGRVMILSHPCTSSLVTIGVHN